MLEPSQLHVFTARSNPLRWTAPHRNWHRFASSMLDAGVSLLPWLNFGRHLTIYKLDVYSLMKKIVASPTSYGLLDVTDSSQGMPVDPDNYLFWDDLHPTTHGHNLVAQSALKTIEPRGCTVEVAPGEYVGVAAPGCK